VGSPPAEIDIDEALVRELLAEQHPDLAGQSVGHLAAGFDNSLWRLGDDLLVRLPRRAIAAPLVVTEQRWLGELASRLPLPVPVPVRVGRPSGAYPWHWSITAWVEGAPGDTATLADPVDAASRLGSFLRALHQPAPLAAPRNPYRSVPLSGRAAAFDERRANLAAVIDGPAIDAVWAHALAAPAWPVAPVWVHGDLHPANLVIAGGTLAAVVDWGDMCAGDPATDLAGAWMLLPPSAMRAFVAAYGDIAPDLEDRALGWAVLFGLMFLEIGIADPRPASEAVGRATLAHVLAHRAPAN